MISEHADLMIFRRRTKANCIKRRFNAKLDFRHVEAQNVDDSYNVDSTKCRSLRFEVLIVIADPVR